MNLPGAGAISNFAIFISVYIPAGIFIGAASAWLIDSISHKLHSRLYNRGYQFIFITLFLILCTLGIRSRILDLKLTEHTLFTRPDQRAVHWINDNLPHDAKFLVNSFFAYGGKAIVGSDGGWWLPLLTNRQTSLPPLNYGSEKGTIDNYSTWVNSLPSLIQTKGINHPDVIDQLIQPRLKLKRALLQSMVWLTLLRAVHAHDPGLSSANVRLFPDKVEANFTFALRDADELAGLDRDRDGTVSPYEFTAAEQRLGKVIAESFEVRFDDELAKATEIRCQFDGDNNNADVFLVVPGKKFVRLSLRSKMIAGFRLDHRQYFLLQDPSGVLMAERLLSADADTVTIEVEAPADRDLARYGSETGEIRKGLKDAIGARIDMIWPQGSSKPANLDTMRSRVGSGAEGLVAAIRGLKPHDDSQRALQSRAVELSAALLQVRWQVLAGTEKSVPVPFIVILLFWLTIIFVSFGLFAPRNATVISSSFVHYLLVAPYSS